VKTPPQTPQANALGERSSVRCGESAWTFEGFNQVVKGHREIDHRCGCGDDDRLAFESAKPMSLSAMMSFNVMGRGLALHQGVFANSVRLGIVLSAMNRGDLTNVPWERLQPLLPAHKPHRGRPAHDHRRLRNGMLWILRTGAPGGIYRGAMAPGAR
jgi:Putative transposase of IS4/5 family (DUF4096)